MKMMNNKVQKFFILAAIALLIAIVMASYGFPSIVKRQIQKNIQISNGTAAFEKWQKIPFPIQFKVYLFNVTNPDEVTQGAKPRLNQVGPYHYDEYREKTILGYGDNDTVQFTVRTRYSFNQQLSGSLSEDDVLTVINFPYLVLVLKVHELMPGMVSLVNGALEDFFTTLEDPFLRARVGDLLFDGVFLNCSADNAALSLVCGRLKQESPETMRVADDADGFYFSMFAHLNDTETAPYDMQRGTLDLRTLGHITRYNNEDKVNAWGDHYCGMINGTDGATFPPIDTGKPPARIYTFEPRICRSMYTSLVGPTTARNLTVYHYEVDRLALACKSAVPSNKCFCRKNWSAKHDGCLLMGIQDLSPCQKVPVIASFPHFYLASEELLEYISEGVAPEREKHRSFVLLEPTTGVLVEGVKRLQFNIELRQLPAARQLANVTTGLFPLLWVEEGAVIPDDIAHVLRKSNVSLGYVEVARWALLVLALIFCAVAGACMVSKHHGWPSRHRSVNMVLSASKPYPVS